MSDTKKLQDLPMDSPVDFDVVVATALAEGVAASVHNDKEFVVQAKDRT
jgi:hypothetical protein